MKNKKIEIITLTANDFLYLQSAFIDMNRDITKDYYLINYITDIIESKETISVLEVKNLRRDFKISLINAMFNSRRIKATYLKDTNHIYLFEGQKGLQDILIKVRENSS